MEGHVLLRVKHFQKSGRRVTLVVGPDLVDLVEDDHGIRSSGLQDSVQNPAGQCSHIGLPVAAEFGFVVHSAQGYPDVFPAERPGDGLAQAGLAHSGRPVKAEDRGLHVALELEHGKVFDNPVLDRLEAVMVIVKYFLGVSQVEVVLRHLAPREVQKEFYVVVLDAVVRRRRIVFLEF